MTTLSSSSIGSGGEGESANLDVKAQTHRSLPPPMAPLFPGSLVSVSIPPSQQQKKQHPSSPLAQTSTPVFAQVDSPSLSTTSVGGTFGKLFRCYCFPKKRRARVRVRIGLFGALSFFAVVGFVASIASYSACSDRRLECISAETKAKEECATRDASWWNSTFATTAENATVAQLPAFLFRDVDERACTGCSKLVIAMTTLGFLSIVSFGALAMSIPRCVESETKDM